MCGEAVLGCAMTGNEGGAGGVQRLDINQGEGPTTVKVSNHNIRLLWQDRAIPKHPLMHGAMPPRPSGLREYTGGSQGC